MVKLLVIVRYTGMYIYMYMRMYMYTCMYMYSVRTCAYSLMSDQASNL